MAGWAASGSRRVRCVWRRATPGSAGTMWVGAPTCTGCWDCAGCWCAPASGAATWPLTCWAGPPARSATTASGCTAIALAAGDVRRRDRTERGERARGQLDSGGRDLRARARGPHARGGRNAQGSVYVRLGAGVARTPRGARNGHHAAGGWRRARRRVVGGSRVRRGAAGRRAAERALGAERAAYGRVSDARHHRRRKRRARPGQGPLPADRPARRQRGDGRQHPRAASRADAAPDAGARHGAVHPGRHPVELHPARPDAGTGGHRLESDRRGGARPGVAHDLGRRSRRGGPGRAAGRLRRARGPRGGSRRPAQREAARGTQVVPLDRGTARLRAGGRVLVRDPRGVRDGPRGRFPRPVRRAAHGCPAGRPAGPRPRPTASWAGKRRPTGRRSRAGCSIRSATRRPEAPPRSRCSG